MYSRCSFNHADQSKGIFQWQYPINFDRAPMVTGFSRTKYTPIILKIWPQYLREIQEYLRKSKQMIFPLIYEQTNRCIKYFADPERDNFDREG